MSNYGFLVKFERISGEQMNDKLTAAFFGPSGALTLTFEYCQDARAGTQLFQLCKALVLSI